MSTVINFDATNIDPTFGGGGSFFPVSDDKGHLVIICGDNGWKTAQSQKGQYLEIVLRCVEGPYNGQEAPLRLNLQHENPQAVQMANGQLSALCHVTGVLRAQTIAEMMNRPFRVVSVAQPQTDADKQAGKQPYTNLADNGIRDVNGNRPSKGAGVQTAQTAPQQPSQPPQMQQPPQGQGGWGGAPAGAPAQNTQPPQNAQGGWGNQAPPQGNQQPPQGDPNANWGGQAPQNTQAPPQGQQGGWNGGGQGGAPSWATQ